MLYKNTKVKVCPPDGDTDWHCSMCAAKKYLFIINVLRTSIDLKKENDFTLVKERSRRYSAQTITDVDYADDIALLANTPAQDKFLQHSLEQVASGIGPHVNADKTEYKEATSPHEMVVLWNSWTSSPTSEEGFHQLKMTSTRDWQRHGQLSIRYWAYRSQTYPIK